MCDAAVSLPFHNIFTGAFGHKSDENKSNLELYFIFQPKPPGLLHYSKWYNHYGVTGRNYWTRKEYRNIFNQIDERIRSNLHGVSQYLTKNLLSDSIFVAEALTSFIITLYDDKIYSGRFESSHNWSFTSKFIKRIFTELSNACLKAQYSMKAGDTCKSEARFLFATLKAQNP